MCVLMDLFSCDEVSVLHHHALGGKNGTEAREYQCATWVTHSQYQQTKGWHPPFSTLYFWSLTQFLSSALTSSYFHSSNNFISHHLNSDCSLIHLIKSISSVKSPHVEEFWTFFEGGGVICSTQKLIIRNEDGLEDLYWLFCTSVWLINEDKLGFSTDKDAGFICFSKSQPDCRSLCFKRPGTFPPSSAFKH